ncbi:MAG TPA: helix-turn-helix domain-containing protein [Dehalococcoidia bacterium]|nr:helix-turn-helix domain-containing protein [Dehalococcoidia bacterium]
MAVLGRILSEARTSRGLTLDDVERDTRIARRYLEALERDEFDALPAPVYCRAFLRTYAQFLGIDPGEILRFYPEKGRQTAELAPLPQVTKSPPPALSLNWIVAGGVILVFLLAGALIYRMSSGGEPGPSADVGVSAQATQPVGEGAEQLNPNAVLQPTVEPTQQQSVQAEDVTVPDVNEAMGMDALVKVKGAGLTYVVVRVYDDEVPEGFVISQSPSPNSTARAGEPVTLVISRGSRP